MSTMSDADCGQAMCNICTATNPTFPCVGVIGAAAQPQTGQATPPPPTDPIWTYGNKNIVPYLWSVTTDPTKQCSNNSGLGLYDESGACIPAYGFNNANLTQKTPLLVDINSLKNVINGSMSNFPLQALHKIWGDEDGEFNKGVNSKNVYINSNPENVIFRVGNTSYSQLQPVLVMEAHGDKYSGTVPGLKRGGKVDANCFKASTQSFYEGSGKVCNPGDSVMPQCTNWVEFDATIPDYNHRVGGVACTRGQYGPGVYNLLAYVPKTEDATTDGRGYVFAMWPFFYSEMYANGIQKVDDTKAPCFEECDGGKAIEPTCPSNQPIPPPPKQPIYCNPNVDLFSVVGGEIDIEVPCNSPQLDWKTQMTWDTMNCNTWLNDISNYDQNTGAYYSQVAVKNPNGNFISNEPESSDQKDYHWYTLDWYVDPSGDLSKNYVAFYFDDPFDPSGTTPIGQSDKLPTAPSGKPVFKTNRFVPTRSGRLNFGPWFGWWGYNAKNNGTPQFDTAKVRMAHLSIIPYANLWDSSGKYLLPEFPQNYDQPGANCDFKDISQPLPPTPGPPAPASNTKSFPIWAIVVIILGTVVLGLVIYAIVDSVHRKKKAKLL